MQRSWSGLTGGGATGQVLLSSLRKGGLPTRCMQVFNWAQDVKPKGGLVRGHFHEYMGALRARWVTLRARWVTLRARWVTQRARWVTLRARWVTLRAR